MVGGRAVHGGRPIFGGVRPCVQLSSQSSLCKIVLGIYRVLQQIEQSFSTCWVLLVSSLQNIAIFSLHRLAQRLLMPTVVLPGSTGANGRVSYQLVNH